MRPTTALRAMLKDDGIVVAPGVYDGLSARLARDAGFAAVYATGGGIARSMGFPDLGLLSMREVTERVAGIVEHAGVPVIADADTGYGNALNVQRTVRELERAGVAALHLEDQVFPKRCGHYDGKAVVPAAEMVQKLRAARDGAQDADLVIIARTDAIAVEGLDAGIERAHAYAPRRQQPRPRRPDGDVRRARGGGADARVPGARPALRRLRPSVSRRPFAFGRNVA